ncbi:MAG: multiple sugar transport system permease protein [Thermomicrobiales bacterium]|nr:multiple sugar transport system permease protein [Thermomicrobiales bacterium]
MAQITRPIEGIGGTGPVTTARPRARRMRALDDSRFFPIALLMPILIFFVIWNIVPLLWLVGVSFYRYKLTSNNPARYIGFQNFENIFNSSVYWGTLSRTLVFMICSVGLATILGVVLGLLFWGSARMPGRRLALTLLFTPMVLPPVAVGTFYRLIYDPTFGVLNYYVKLITGKPIDFLGDKDYAFWAVVAVDVWMWTPFMILMTLAALGSVPRAELEAAEVDRLPWLKRLWYIVLPHGKFILMLGILLRTIDAFKTTDLVNLMTRGGPGNKTETIGMTLYRQGFEAYQMGSASALAVIALLIAISFTSIYLYVLNYRETKAALR